MPKAVRKIWKTEDRQEENPLSKENTTFFLNLDIKVKVDILNSLCYLRLDQPDAINALKEMDADSLRVQPLGCDDEGNEYWYFYGLRLYKQEPAREKIKKEIGKEVEWNEQKSRSFLKRGRGRPKKQRKLVGECDDFDDAPMKKHGIFDIEEKSRWSAVCHDIEDWIEFAEKFKDRKVTDEASGINAKASFYKNGDEKTRNPPPPPPVNEDNYKKYLVQDRAQRLEERNRRMNGNVNKQSRKTRRSFEENSNIERRSKRLRRTSYDDDDEEEDDFVEESSPKSDDSEDNILIRKKSGVKSLILQVLAEVKSQEDAVPFLFQMTESNAPGYYDIIEEPMDLSKIERKLRLGLYKTVDDIDNDFKIMLLNHQSYYGNQSEFVHKGKKDLETVPKTCYSHQT
ncbi:cat eye syndrome critical region protein 2 [Caerostris extrusa]|uniref:Cat eye syndrome critical region protein 2 n=1 Tax=Caerostris extrusa TaxID=172846 RepID=A0AAV4VCE0_CAEEX|nr:cat eye syndrome critical region protein 2 [Caerostris extrusa]